MDGSGKRFNQGKTRHDLVPPFAQEEYAKVLTFGSNKYGDRNWEKGMKWTHVLASLKRHINAFELGEDKDPETGLLHMAHAMCNAAFLTEYYKIYPNGDDRNHWYKKSPKIGLDVDEVIADWLVSYRERYNMTIPLNWHFDRFFSDRMSELKKDEEFWKSIPPKIYPNSIPFEPFCYITSRPVPTEWTERWIEKNGFSTAPVYTVGPGETKGMIARKVGLDWFVDDCYSHFVEVNEAGVCCFLLDAPHNARYDVGFKRIKKLSDLPLIARSYDSQ